MTRALLALTLLAVQIRDSSLGVRGDRGTVLGGALGRSKVVVSIQAKEEVAADVLGDNPALSQFGDRVLVIQNLSISVDGRALFVPRSSYADLVGVRSAELKPLRADSLAIVIRGGDASTAFEAHIEFDAVAVKRRRLVAPELGAGQPTEETTYTRRVLRDVP